VFVIIAASTAPNIAQNGANAGRLMPEKEQQRILRQAVNLFGRKAIIEGLKLSDATLDGWLNGISDMPNRQLLALADLLVKLAASGRTP
jgi:hypothetical protein